MSLRGQGSGCSHSLSLAAFGAIAPPMHFLSEQPRQQSCSGPRIENARDGSILCVTGATGDLQPIRGRDQEPHRRNKGTWQIDDASVLFTRLSAFLKVNLNGGHMADGLGPGRVVFSEINTDVNLRSANGYFMAGRNEITMH